MLESKKKMSLLKKIFATVMTLSLMLSVAAPGMARAETADDLQAQIEALQAQLDALLAQLSDLEGDGEDGEDDTGGACPSACAGVSSFDRSLSQGMSGSDVKCLQAMLNRDSDTKLADSGAGSPGNETEYFGPITKAAAIKFQEKYASDVLAPWGLSTGTGYFGSTSRSKMNELLTACADEPEEPEEPEDEPGDYDNQTDCEAANYYWYDDVCNAEAEEPEQPDAGEVSVSLADDTPAAATIISDGSGGVAGSQALIDVLKLTFSVPAGETAKVTKVVLKRTGICTDSDIDQVYLYDGSTKLAEMNSLSLGVATFSNSAGLFTVGSSKDIMVKFDLDKDSTAGKTIGFKLESASDIETAGGATISASVPLQGNTMTVATVSDFGRLDIQASTNSASVDPGTTGFEAMRLTAAGSNQDVKLYKLKLLQLGSIDPSDLANFKLYDGGVELSSVASVASDGTLEFDLTSSPLTIAAGVTKTLSVRCDVTGGSTRTLQFSIQRATDVQAIDDNYNVYLAVDAGTIGTFSIQNSTQTTVSSGNLVVTKANDSPSGNVAFNASNISLAKYSLQAVGEDIKVSEIKFQVTLTGSADDLKNMRLIFDGSQVGTTQIDVNTGTETTVSVNFTVPAGETKALEIKSDIASTSTTVSSGHPLADTDTITAQLNAGSSNAQRGTSLGTFNTPSANIAANAVTVSSASLSAVKNASVGNMTLVDGSTNQRIASLLMTAGASEGVDVSSVTLESCATGAGGTDGTRALGNTFTNLKLMSGSTQLGSTYVTNSSDAAGTTYAFYPSPAFTVAAGDTIQVDVYADIRSSNTWNDTDAVELDSATGTGQVTSSAANITAGASASADAQDITLASAGTLSVERDDIYSPTYTQVSMGATDQVMAAWKFEANTVESLEVNQIEVTESTGSASGNVNNIRLFVDGSQVGSAVPAFDANAEAWFRNLSFVIPAGEGKTVIAKADVTPYSQSPSAGTAVTFQVKLPATGGITGATANTIIAKGDTSGQYAATDVGSETAYTGYGQYPYRTVLTAALSTTRTATGNTRSSDDKVATLELSGTSSTTAKMASGSEPTTIAEGVGAATGVLATTTTSGDQVDGSGSSWDLTTATAGSSISFDAGSATALFNSVALYSRVSFWLKVNRASGNGITTDFFVSTSTASDSVGANATVVVIPDLSGTALTDNIWYFVDMTIPTLAASHRYIHVETQAIGSLSNGDDVYIDKLTAYNDSVVLDVAGNLNATAPKGTQFSVKSGGTTVGYGYYTGTTTAGTAKIIPTTTFQAGTTTANYDVWVSTTALMATDASGVNESLSLRCDFGTPSADGDFQWYDQGISAVTSPIGWINPVGGLSSVSMAY